MVNSEIIEEKRETVLDTGGVQFNELEYKNKMLATVINSSQVGVYVTDYYTGEILYANRQMMEYVGDNFSVGEMISNNVEAEEITGKICWKLLNFYGDGRCDFCPYELLIDSDGNPSGKYIWEHYFDNFDIWLKIISEAIAWADGRLAQMVTFYDITEIKKMQDHLASLAYTDQFLKVKNAVKLEQDLKGLTAKPDLIVFDILSMHKINEAYGREMGDRLLTSIRDWILGLNITGIEFYRIDGDEFCLAVHRNDQCTLNEITAALSEKFEKAWTVENINGKNVFIYCNVTIAVIRAGFIREDEPVLNLIERTIKFAKNNRGITSYDGELDREFKNSLRFELSLKSCVRENMKGFELHYQPIVDPVSGRWHSLEALCRWSSPEFGSVSPLVFIAEAERLSLIDNVGIWVLETSIKVCKELALDRLENFMLDVNISAIQFTDEKLASKVIKLLDYYDYPGEKLCLEITESTQFTFTDLSLHTINRLRARKVLVALDDFGTGYSCFNNLNKLPVDILKIERDFIINIERDSYQQHLFRTMSDLAHILEMKLITEGIENPKQSEIVINGGTDYIQGYLFSKPLSLDDLKKNLYKFHTM